MVLHLVRRDLTASQCTKRLKLTEGEQLRYTRKSARIGPPDMDSAVLSENIRLTEGIVTIRNDFIRSGGVERDCWVTYSASAIRGGVEAEFWTGLSTLFQNVRRIEV